jgi:hypothetical protein
MVRKPTMGGSLCLTYWVPLFGLAQVQRRLNDAASFHLLCMPDAFRSDEVQAELVEQVWANRVPIRCEALLL